MSGFFQLAMTDRILVVLIISTLLLFMTALLLAIFAFFFRLHNAWVARRWSKLEGVWESEILAIFSNDRSEEELISNIRRKDVLYFLEYLLRFIQKFTGDEKKVICRLAHPFLGRIVGGARSRNPERRAQAIHILGVFGIEKYSKWIIAALEDHSPFVVMVAARVLVRVENPEFAKWVLAKLDRFQSWNTHFLSSFLATVGAAIVPDLQAMLADRNQSSFVRVVSAEALRKLNDFGAADVAFRILGDESDRELIAACLRLMRKVAREEHLDLIRRLMGASDYIIRAHAVNVVGHLGNSSDVHILSTMMEDSSPWVARYAASGLKELGAISILECLIKSGHPRSKLAEQVLAEGIPIS